MLWWLVMVHCPERISPKMQTCRQVQLIDRQIEWQCGYRFLDVQSEIGNQKARSELQQQVSAIVWQQAVSQR
jgi:hypothetical protein